MNIALKTNNLTKIYNLGKKKGNKIALDSLSIEVEEGTIFGFLGPNGAGKTTTIKTVLDFLHPTRGSAEIFGKPTTDAATRKYVGYLPEQPYFPKFMKPIEVLCMHAELSDVDSSQIKKQSMLSLERAGIAEYAHTPISKLSKGLTQRVGIAQAIVSNPKLLILDEPNSGLDPIGRHHTRDLLLDLKKEGKTIFLSSHILGEIENICDVVAVMKNGHLAACGTPDTIRNGSTHIVIQTKEIDNETTERLKFINCNIENYNCTTILKIDPDNLYNTLHILETSKLPVIRIDTVRESLEDAFLRLAA